MGFERHVHSNDVAHALCGASNEDCGYQPVGCDVMVIVAVSFCSN
jgi:hypothetical protein